MSKVSFFRQKRKDTGIRTGVEVDEDTVLHSFDPGKGAPDSALLWYIDVRIETHAVVHKEATAARSFLIDAAGPITAALTSAADDLRAGLDLDIWPRTSSIVNLPAGTIGELVCSSMVRVAPGELAQVLRDLAEKWSQTVAQLAVVPPEN